MAEENKNQQGNTQGVGGGSQQQDQGGSAASWEDALASLAQQQSSEAGPVATNFGPEEPVKKKKKRRRKKKKPQDQIAERREEGAESREQRGERRKERGESVGKESREQKPREEKTQEEKTREQKTQGEKLGVVAQTPQEQGPSAVAKTPQPQKIDSIGDSAALPTWEDAMQTMAEEQKAESRKEKVESREEKGEFDTGVISKEPVFSPKSTPEPLQEPNSALEDLDVFDEPPPPPGTQPGLESEFVMDSDSKFVPESQPQKELQSEPQPEPEPQPQSELGVEPEGELLDADDSDLLGEDESGGVNKKHLYIGIGCVLLFLAVVIVGFFIVKNLWLDSADKNENDDANKVSELEEIVEEEPVKPEEQPEDQVEEGGNIQKDVELEPLDRPFLVPGISPAFIAVSKVGQTMTPQGRFIYYVDVVKRLKILYETDILQLLDQTSDRRASLDAYLGALESVQVEAGTTLEHVIQEQEQLASNFETVTLQKDASESAFFESLGQLDGISADENLSEFTQLIRRYSAIRARYRALTNVRDFYERALPKLNARIVDIKANVEALVEGIKVVDIEDSDLGLIITEL